MGDARRRVSFSQLEKLCELLETRRDLAIGNNKTTQSREIHCKKWKEVAQKLNLHRDGTIKDWKGWCKYWIDYKCRLKKMAAAVRAEQQETGEITKSISDIDIKFLDMIGEYDVKSGMWNTKTEPLKVETNNTLLQPYSIEFSSSESASELKTYQAGPSQATFASIPSDPHLVPTKRTRKLRSSLSTSPSPPSSPHRSPIRSRTSRLRVRAYPQRTSSRRRSSRRESSMTTEDTLIAESKKQTRIQEKKLELFSMLVSELREIKEILRNRSNGNGADAV